MCQLVKNINSKSSAINVAIHSKEDTYEVLEAIEGFRGAVILNHINEYFEGNETKGLEDIVANTDYKLASLKNSLTANTNRLKAIELAKKLRLVEETKANEAKEREKEARAKLDKKLEAKAKEDRIKAEAEAKKMSKAEEVLETVKETVINKGMSGTTTEEKLEIALVIPEGATVKEVKKITAMTKALNGMDETKATIIKELLVKHPSMQKWTNLEAVYASKIGGLKGNLAHKEVVALHDPTTAEVAELRLSILTAKRASNDICDKTAERNELGCQIETHETEAYKARQLEIAKEAEEAVAKHEEKTKESIPLPTAKLNIPKGRMSKANADIITQSLVALGMTEDNLINYLKTMAEELNLAKKLKSIIK